MNPREELSQQIVAAFCDWADRTGFQKPLTTSADHLCAKHGVPLNMLQEASDIYGRQHGAPRRWNLERGKVTVFPGEWGTH